MSEASFPTLEERVLAALAHISILLMGVGIFAPALVWVIKRRKSAYTSFQALQALGFEVFFTFYATMIVLVAMIVVILLAFAGVGFKNPVTSLPVWANIAIIGVVALAVGLTLLYLLVGIVGALACLFGKDFRYPYLGSRLVVYLRQSSDEGFDQDHEDRYVAAMGHAGIMTQYWGITAPLIAWLASKGRSNLLRFQSLQALVFQGLGTAIWIVVSLILFGFFGIAVVLGMMGDTLPGAMIGSINGLSLALALISIILFMVFMLLWPLISTLGLVASFRLLKGRDYEYPLVGRLVKRWG
jgi:uncharacterized Tic20 family protein